MTHTAKSITKLAGMTRILNNTQQKSWNSNWSFLLPPSLPRHCRKQILLGVLLRHHVHLFVMNHMIVARLQVPALPFQRALTQEPSRVSALSAEGLGIAGVTARSQPPRKELTSWRAGKMVESSSSLQEPSHAPNGTSEQNAKTTIEPLTISAPFAGPKTTLFPPGNVSNFEKNCNSS